MKINNKGFSVVELLVSFILVTIIVTGMLTIAIQYERKATLSEVKLDMIKVKENVTRKVMEDIKNGDNKLIKIEDCSNDSEKCVNFTYSDNSTKRLEVNANAKVIKYNNELFNLASRSTMDINNSSILQNMGDNIYKISVPIHNLDIEGDYGLDITINIG